MTAKQTSKLNTNPQRDRFSNFVVDLRPQKALKSAERLAPGPIVKEQLSRISNQVKKMKPDLLRPEKTIFARIRALKFSYRLPSFKFSFFRQRRSPWQDFKFKREKEFQALVRAVRPSRHLKKFKFSKIPPIRANWYGPLLSFAVVLILIIIPFKLLAYFHVGDFSAWEQEIKLQSKTAVANLLAGAQAVSQQDFQGADDNFQAAGANFLAAQAELSHINDSLLALASFSNNPEIKLAAQSKNFLAAGATASSLGRNLVLATDKLLDSQQTDFSVRLSSFLEYGSKAVEEAESLEKIISRIKVTDLPEEYRGQFIALSQQTSRLAATLGSFVEAGQKFKEVLGLTRDKRYLIVFQNNAELRASGGFLGSYALVDIRQGGIKNLEVPAGGSYDTEAGRRVSVVAPEPLWLVDPLWHFWDANWWPDWPTTAKNLMWFYEKSGGPTVDGVIGVTPSVVESLLEITGPIDMGEEYGLVINSDNFWETVERVVERNNLAISHPQEIDSIPSIPATAIVSSIPLLQDLENNSDNKPKKIIGDLLVRIMEVLPSKLDRDNLPKILSVFEQNMSAKHILLYFSDPQLQAELAQHNWSGEIRSTRADYLMVVNTNIAGQKSDRLMQEAIDHQSEITSDGSIINTINITRTHKGIKNEPLTGVRNVDWLRIYVPEGSELLEASGFRRPDDIYLQDRPEASWQNRPELLAENSARIDQASLTKIYEENNKTVFANWLMVDPGETAVVTIKYRLPYNLYHLSTSQGWREHLNSWLNPGDRELIPYSLLVQKQPGAAPSSFTSRLQLPSGLDVFWRYPDDLPVSKNSWEISSMLDKDKYWSIIVRNNK